MPPKRINLSFLATQLDQARTGVGFDAFKYEEIATVLHSAYEFDQAVPQAEIGQLIWEAVSTIPATSTIAAQNLRAALRRVEQRFLRRATSKSLLVTSISLPLNPGINGRELMRGGVRISRRMPARYKRSRQDPIQRIPEADWEPAGYSTVIVRTEGRSHHEAVNIALDRLDLLRASWNYARNRRTIFSLNSGHQDPINSIRLGRIHTLHDTTGQSMISGHWYDSRFTPLQRQYSGGMGWASLDRMHNQIRARLLGHPYRDDVERGLIRYVRALDGADFESTFLKLWSLLEYLTNSGGSNYDVTVRRIEFLFTDRQLTRSILEHLRGQRNRVVHADKSGASFGSLTWQAKRYAEQLLFFHLSSGRKLASMAEAGKLLDLPTDKTILKRLRWLNRQAEVFLA